MTTVPLVRMAALVFTAVTFVVIGDTAGKLLTGSGVDPVFVAWSRFAIAAVLLLPFSGLRVKELPKLFDGWVFARACIIAAAICCILTALKTEPIANVFGAFFVGPIVSYGLAIAFLGERPSRLRSALLAVGFLGVLLVVKPGFGGASGMVFALMAGVLYGGYLATTRATAGHYRPRFLLLSQLVIGSVVLMPFGLSVALPAPELPILGLVLVSALGSAIGNYMLVLANQRTEASIIAPLVYTQLISATVIGVLVFGDWPDLAAMLGLVLILLSGIGSLLALPKTRNAPS